MSDTETFVGEIVSPSPSCPQDIVSLGDNGWMWMLVCGDNILDLNKLSIGVSSRVNFNLYLKPNTSYTLSSNALSSNIKYYLLSYEASKTEESAVYIDHPISVTTDSEGRLNIQSEDNTGTTKYIPEYWYTLEEGETSSGEIPFTGEYINISGLTEPLRSINNVRDELMELDNEYGIYRRIYKHTLSSTDTLTMKETSTVGTYKIIYNNILNKVGNNTIKENIMCNRYIVVSSDNASTNLTQSISLDSEKNICIQDDTYNTETSLADYKTWLDGNTVYFICELETPVFEPLPEATQKLIRSIKIKNNDNVFLNSNLGSINLKYYTNTSHGEAISELKDYSIKIDNDLSELSGTVSTDVSDLKTRVSTTETTCSNLQTEIASKSSSIIKSNVSITSTDYASSTTYESYPYKVSIAITGVTANHVPIVNLSLADSTSGVFSSISETADGYVYLYANNIVATTIPSIVCMI